MKNINNVTIKYYCNSCGEVFDPDIQDPRGPEFGAKLLDYPSDLPKELYRLYMDYWTEFQSVLCYLAVVDCKPGLLVVSEHDKQDYYAMLCRAQGLEVIAHAISTECIILTGQNTGCNECNELMLFIPNSLESNAVYKLMFLMEKYAGTRESVCVDDVFAEDAPDYLTFLRKVDHKRIERPKHDYGTAALVLIDMQDVDGCGAYTVMPIFVFRPLTFGEESQLKNRLSAIRASGNYNEDTDDVIIEYACNDVLGSKGFEWDFAKVSSYIEF